MKLSKQATDRLLMQRSDLRDVPKDELIPRYLQSCKRSADIISNAIEYKPTTAFDMGCGMGGVSVALSWIWPDCYFTCADYDRIDNDKRKFNYGDADTFAAYNSLDATRELLNANKVKGRVIDVANGYQGFRYDLIFSVLSWGFHYPVRTYAAWAAVAGNMLIIDCREGQGAVDELRKYWFDVELIFARGKHEWYKCTRQSLVIPTEADLERLLDEVYEKHLRAWVREEYS